MRTILFLLAAALIAAVLYYPSMPEQIASHFSADGTADGWMDKNAFFVLYGVLFLFIGGVFAGIATLTPRLPDSMINVPHREYWLSPERRTESLATITRSLYQMGAATLIFLLVLMILTFEANGEPAPRLGSTSWVVIICYFGVTAWQVIRLIVHFRKP